MRRKINTGKQHQCKGSTNDYFTITFIYYSPANKNKQNNIERFIEKFNENPGPGTYYENILNNSCDNIKKVAYLLKKIKIV